MAGMTGLEPATSCVTSKRANHCATSPCRFGELYRIRTYDPFGVNEMRYHCANNSLN